MNWPKRKSGIPSWQAGLYKLLGIEPKSTPATTDAEVVKKIVANSKAESQSLVFKGNGVPMAIVTKFQLTNEQLNDFKSMETKISMGMKNAVAQAKAAGEALAALNAEKKIAFIKKVSEYAILPSDAELPETAKLKQAMDEAFTAVKQWPPYKGTVFTDVKIAQKNIKAGAHLGLWQEGLVNKPADLHAAVAEKAFNTFYLADPPNLTVNDVKAFVPLKDPAIQAADGKKFSEYEDKLYYELLGIPKLEDTPPAKIKIPDHQYEGVFFEPAHPPKVEEPLELVELTITGLTPEEADEVLKNYGKQKTSGPPVMVAKKKMKDIGTGSKAIIKWEFESSSMVSNGTPVKYIAQLNEDGTMSCQCRGWTQGSAKSAEGRFCKHTKALEEQFDVKDLFKKWKKGEPLGDDFDVAPSTDSVTPLSKKEKSTGETVFKAKRIVEL